MLFTNVIPMAIGRGDTKFETNYMYIGKTFNTDFGAELCDQENSQYILTHP